ncbi:MAG: cation:proton antiporter subunit C [Candidatus Cloacimonetes bacterium]|nr:cation:proton antiporter subunit C [Candidatus Cloacimonadota bacterium]
MILLILIIAVYGLIVSDNLIKKIMCLNIIESTVILTFLTTGYQERAVAPIITDTVANYVDPIPQALMLTAIVIGVCFNSLAIAITVKVFYKYHTIEVSQLHER